MPPYLAASIFTVGILGLFWLTREEQAGTSSAMWIPVFWMFLAGSRSFSTWLGAVQSVSDPDQYLNGSPVDSAIITFLLVAGLIVLAMRQRKTIAFLRSNAPVLIFLAYCLFSALWSDYPFVAFKRWTKALGNVVMVLIVLTDPKPVEAARRFLTRPGFVAIPLSLLFIKYFPVWGRTYDPFTGQVAYTGIMDVKNGLGWDCLVFGLASVWSIMDAIRDPAVTKNRRLLAHGTILLMALYLLHLANSATSETCLALGCAVLFFIALFAKRRPARVHFIAAALAGVGLMFYLFPDSYAFLVHSLGRETNLTGRTDIWQDVLKLDKSPIVGTGFESFFLGDRLRILWAKYWWHPQEAHDGYLETYLTLGWVGVGLLAMLIVTGYRNAMRGLRDNADLGSLRMAFLFVAIVYNVTEAAFKVMHPIWIMFLFCVMAIPRVSEAVPAGKPVHARIPVRKRVARPRPAYSPSARTTISTSASTSA